MEGDWGSIYWFFMKAEEEAERSRRRKHCYKVCDICDHCALYTPDFPECRRCYPTNMEYRRIAGRWEHCRCRQLPWQDFVGGKLRDNLVLAPLSGGRRQQFREQVRQEGRRGDAAGRSGEELREALRR
jgi:hypothetical protein